MESITLVAVVTAIVTIASKPLEKIGENIGDVIWTQVGELITKLREKKLVPRLIKVVDSTETQPLDYGQAVLELTAAAKKDPEIAKAVLDVETAVNNNHSETAKKIKAKAEEIKNQDSVIKNYNYNFSKFAEEIKGDKNVFIQSNEGEVNIT
ncbi:MAG: hypothetical protein HEQ29_22160 [Dolichospermum sp. LBC05a]|jgi:hypothetical protein|nr:hypothetical protein [Dolichospermum sp. OL01]MCO5799332.1 hypothetical protein [Dolichospermum sp. OL03]MCS6281507.1 hypothetical protein [Dolichospermum sp.]QSV60692.1 MAG: hypothetical protein HEQ29_22160 [Dolichospermum sp. LBC05a]QSV62043.1 MAG: hypothetical protein HEQ26_03970 [Dolichospermum sp. DL01]